MKKKPEPIGKPKQLVVEGRQLQKFCIKLVNHLGLDEIQVQDFGGTFEIKKFLPMLKILTNFKSTVTSLGIIRDAETNPRGAIRSLRYTLTKFGFSSPSQPMKFSRQKKPRVKFMILPDNRSPGMLETLCMESVKGDTVIPCINDFFTCLQSTPGWTANKITKARMQVFLATRDKPGLTVGEAAYASYWPWSSPVFDELKDFLRTL